MRRYAEAGALNFTLTLGSGAGTAPLIRWNGLYNGKGGPWIDDANKVVQTPPSLCDNFWGPDAPRSDEVAGSGSPSRLAYFFLLYAVVELSVAALVLAHGLPRPLHEPTTDIFFGETFRMVAGLGLFLLAFGSGSDDARMFAGGFAANLPDGVFGLSNATEANALLASRGDVELSANVLISWFCYFDHEVVGGFFILPGLYLWHVAVSLPQKPRGELCCGDRVTVLLQPLNNRLIGGIGAVFALGLLILGAWSFASYTATGRMVLEYNDDLRLWTWKSGRNNPFGLIGVFSSSFFWLLIGIGLWQRRNSPWFLVVQVVSLLGQGAAGGLGDKKGIVSNLMELAVTWALLVLGWQLAREVQEAKQGGTALSLQEGLLYQQDTEEAAAVGPAAAAASSEHEGGRYVAM